MIVQYGIDNTLFPLRDTWCYQHSTLFSSFQQFCLFLNVLRCQMCGYALLVLPMEKHLKPIRILQQEQIAKGRIFTVMNP